MDALRAQSPAILPVLFPSPVHLQLLATKTTLAGPPVQWSILSPHPTRPSVALDTARPLPPPRSTLCPLPSPHAPGFPPKSLATPLHQAPPWPLSAQGLSPPSSPPSSTIPLSVSSRFSAVNTPSTALFPLKCVIHHLSLTPFFLTHAFLPPASH